MKEIINGLEDVISDDEWENVKDHPRAKRAGNYMKAKKSKKKRLTGYFEEIEEFNRVIIQLAVRKSGKE